MLILITSCLNNEGYREALRQTWLKDVNYTYLFLVGGAKQTHIIDDVLHLAVDDSYNFVQEKQLEAFKYCLNNHSFNHIFICDDDAYVRMDRLLDSDYHLHDYYGGGPVKMWDRPYYAYGGPGITLSKKAVQAIVDNGEKHLHALISPMVAACNQTHRDQYWADRFIGLTLDDVGIKPFYDKRFVDINFDPLTEAPKQYNDVIAYHGKLNMPKVNVSPEQIVEMHKHFEKYFKPIRVAMVLDQWSKGGAEKEFADMIIDANPNKIQYVGIALNIAHEFYIRNDLKGKLPPFHTHKQHGYDVAIDKEYLNLHDTFEEAIDAAVGNADVIIKWHTANRFLENIDKPSILLSNATSWYTEFKYQKLFADKYVGNSRWSTDWLPKQAKDKLVIYSGHSEDRVKPQKGRDNFRESIGFTKDDKVVSHIGRVNLDKNLEVLIKSVSSLSEDWKLMLVGRIPVFNEEKLMALLKEHLPNRYKLVPWVDHVGDAFAATDVFTLTSYYEGFSNALAEAWMSKTPTVFSKCGAADELIEVYGNIGIAVQTNATIKEIAESIKKAPLNKEGITNAYNMIKTFTREKASRNWERCITETCYNRKKLKVGLLIPNLSFGGIEVWTETLVKNTSRGDIEYFIIKPNGNGVKSDISTIINLSKYSEIHIEKSEPDIFTEISDIGVPNVYFYNNHFALMQSAKDLDCIVTWGIEDLEPLVLSLDMPIIICSQCADEWNIKTLEKNCHLGNNFVAISEAANIFPKDIKKSVSFISNPAKKLEPNQSRTETRVIWGAASDDILVGFIGRWEYQKNPLLLAKAINELEPNYKAVFIGCDWRMRKNADLENWDYTYDKEGNLVDSTYMDELTNILNPDRYILISPQENMGNCYEALDAVVVPSRAEGFCIVMLETWLMKKPLVCTDVGIYKHFKNFANRILAIQIDNDPKNVARAIEESLNIDEHQLEYVKDLAFEKFNNSIFINKWVDLIQKTVENYKKFHKRIVLPDPYFEIYELMKKHKTAKKVARALNINKFPLPKGEKEWTYILVNQYLN